MKFLEKNNHIVHLKNEAHFEADHALFQKYFPAHLLNKELAKANQFTKSRLDGQMIMLLLDKVSPEAIKKSRETFSSKAEFNSDQGPELIASIQEAKVLFCQFTGWPMDSIDAVSIIKDAIGVNREDFIKTVTSNKHYMIFKEDNDELPANQNKQEKAVEQTGKKKASTTSSQE